MALDIAGSLTSKKPELLLAMLSDPYGTGKRAM
jgi:hypothetical protein